MGAHSQGTDSVMQFSIKQAVDFSFENQKDVLNSQLDVQIAEYQVKETIGLGLPQISGEFDFVANRRIFETRGECFAYN